MKPAAPDRPKARRPKGGRPGQDPAQTAAAPSPDAPEAAAPANAAQPRGKGPGGRKGGKEGGKAGAKAAARAAGKPDRPARAGVGGQGRGKNRRDHATAEADEAQIDTAQIDTAPAATAAAEGAPPPAAPPPLPGAPAPLAEAEDDDEALDDGSEAPRPVLPAPGWLVDLRRSAHRRGNYTALGDHAVVFTDRGAQHLVVSFDNLSQARDAAMDRDPWGYGFVAKNGWSHLAVMSFTPNWYRDEDLFAHLRGLAEQGFFRRFESVTMIGTSMGGYGACAFAALAPGCRVVAFSPQSTLDKARVPWEKRFSSGRKADWSGDFADAAETARDAAQVWLVYDPFDADDARHAARFAGPNVHLLRARHGGHKTALFLRRAGLLSTVVRDVIEGRMSDVHFYRLYRSGRHLPWFLHGIADTAKANGRLGLIGRIVLHVRARGNGYAAHMIRKKYLSDPATDPLRIAARAARAQARKSAGETK